tara:strand:- start:917 stop:1036 length:120 start_codon:yes stop_codon:yes gene_type:complete
VSAKRSGDMADIIAPQSRTRTKIKRELRKIEKKKVMEVW